MVQNPEESVATHHWPKWALWTVAVLPPVAWIFCIWLSYAHRTRFLELAKEDGLIENLQVAFLVAAAIVSARIAIVLKGRGERRFALLYGAFALLVFLAAGEEISWGQRLFDTETPAWLPNSQGETNLHNLSGVMLLISIAIEYSLIILSALSIVVWVFDRSLVARWRAGFWLPSPILITAWICPLTHTNGFVEKVYRFWDAEEADAKFGVLSRLQEPAELIMMFGGVMFLIMTLGRIRNTANKSPVPA